MRSPLSGPIATLLMFVPLVAIPVLALVGMPQFATTSASTQLEDLKFASDKSSTKTTPPEGELIGGVQVTETAAPAQTTEGTPPERRNDSERRSDSDPFAEFVRPPDGDAAHPAQTESRQADVASSNRNSSPGRRPQHWPPDEPTIQPQKPPVALGEAGAPEGKAPSAGSEVAPVDPASINPDERTRSKAGTRLTTAFDTTRQTADATSLSPDASKGPSEEARNWKSAVARLNSLGISEYQFQPGDREGEVHFSCRFVSRTNPRIVRRFEAEAREPLEAVQQVLDQVDEWKDRRTESGVRVSSGNPPSKVTALAAPDEGVPRSAIDAYNR